MKVLIVGPNWFGGWTQGLARAVRARGDEPCAFYYTDDSGGSLVQRVKATLPTGLRNLSRAVAQQLRFVGHTLMEHRLRWVVEREKPDLTILLKGDGLRRSTVESLRANSRQFVAWWLDDPADDPSFRVQSEVCEFLFLFDQACVEERRVGRSNPVEYLPCAFDDSVFYPKCPSTGEKTALSCELAFVASYHPSRKDSVDTLVEFNVGVWGPGWETAPLRPKVWRAPFLEQSKAATLYGLAPICLNAHHPQTRVGGFNTRTVEILGAGGFELVDAVPGLAQSFELGSELVTYSDTRELKDLTAFYLRHPSERSAIAARGRRRALASHTYSHRYASMLEFLGT